MKRYRSKFTVLILFLLMFSGCSVLQPKPTATPTQTPIPTSTLTPTNTPTITPSPTLTPTLTPTFTPTPISPEDLIAKNSLGNQTRVNVDLEILRLLLADKEILLLGHPQVQSDKIPPTRFGNPIFDDKPLVGEIVLRFTNLGEDVNTLFVSDLIIQVMGGQIVLDDYIMAEAYYTKGANPFNPDILPGSTIYLTYWFGIEDVDLSEIKELAVYLEAPYEVMRDGSWLYTGQNYYFTFDLSEWGFEPMPEEVFDAIY